MRQPGQVWIAELEGMSDHPPRVTGLGLCQNVDGHSPGPGGGEGPCARRLQKNAPGQFHIDITRIFDFHGRKHACARTEIISDNVGSAGRQKGIDFRIGQDISEKIDRYAIIVGTFRDRFRYD